MTFPSGFLGIGSCTVHRDDLASEFAACSYSWDTTAGGASLNSGGDTFQTDFDDIGGTSGPLIHGGGPVFQIPVGGTLSVSLFVEVSGQAIARAAVPAPVPAPATGALLTIGLAGLGAWRWRGRRR
jgi:hypothetical protein